VRVVAIICALGCGSAGPAFAERPVHGSVGGGHSFWLTGHGDDRNRWELALDIEPASRFGGHIAWRGFDDKHRGLLLGGIVYEAGAARPRLVVDLHGDVGADLDAKAPVVGGGVRTTLTLWKVIGLALDGGSYLVIDGVEDTRLVIATSSSLVIRW
jgi:hypothetical protein